MSNQASNADVERRKRDLRLRIGRQRRLIDARLRSARDRGNRLLSWRWYVESYPGAAVISALGVGLGVSAGLKRGGLARWLGFRLVRRGTNRLGRLVWREIERIWTDSTPEKKTTNTTGTPDGRI